jgi:WD40 repeat protein
MVNQTKLLNAVGTTWDACIRIFPVGEKAQTVVFSNKGALIAACGYDWVKIFDTITGANRTTFHKGTFILSIAFSPDDDFLATGISGGTLNVWDVQTGTLFRTFKGDMYVYSVSFSPDGNMIAAGGNDGTIQIWNILSGGCDYISVHHSAGVNSVCWLDGQQVMSGSSDRTVRRWDVQQARGSSIYAEYPSGVINIASSRGSILVASTDGTRKIYDSQSGDVIHTMPPAGLTRCQLSIDGDKNLVANKNSGFIWDLTSKTQVQSIGYNGDGATFSPYGTYVASIYGKFLKIWKTHTRHEVQGPSTNLLNEEIHYGSFLVLIRQRYYIGRVFADLCRMSPSLFQFCLHARRRFMEYSHF